MGRSSRISMFLLTGLGLASGPLRAATVPVAIKVPGVRFAHDLRDQHRFGHRHRDFGFDSIVAGFVGGDPGASAGPHPARPFPVRAQNPCIRPLVIVIDQDKTPAANKPRVLYGAPPCGADR